ncbi:MAG: response regulator transcription factor [Oscillospiraceae bacterium]|nr:response regulator transcription factor [Oscillospiraceae bacterium]
MPHILIIDDDLHIGNLLEETLKAEGYGVSRAFSGTKALEVLSREKPDLILLDLMLPELSGEELLPKIKDIPVIVVSAKIDVSNKVDLLLGGAADYVTKPFDTRELLARIAVQLRKNNENELTFRELTLYADILTVKVENTEIRLTRTECAILKLLMQNPRNPVGKTTILDRISLDTPDCTERSLKQHISNIRKKLQAVNGEDYIEAVYGIGFKMKS